MKKHGDALLAALRLIEPKDQWRGWENGHGEEIGERIEKAIREHLRSTPKRARGK